jgi:Protein of unknown function (DUF3987)
VEYTADLESPERFRRWAAISAIGAVLERKVYVAPGGHVLYPNLYVFLVGPPGVGKSRVIEFGIKRFVEQLNEPHIVPKSMTMASLVDFLNEEGKRTIIKPRGEPMEYYTAYMLADELSVFMSKWDEGVTAGLTSYWDGTEYSEWRRTSGKKVVMKQLAFSILAGCTPGHLATCVPEGAWDQGFMSRVIMVYANQRTLTDIFKVKPINELPADMVHDLHYINTLEGEVGWDQDFADMFNKWRECDEAKDKTAIGPTNPRLVHYNTRRTAQMLKLSTIACVDRGELLMLNLHDFRRAYSWLKEAEAVMEGAFEAASASADGKALDDIAHYVIQQFTKTGKSVPEHVIVLFASKKLPVHGVTNAIKLLESMNRIKVKGVDSKGQRRFVPGT